MQKSDRIQFLENLKLELPDDPFAWYALQLEKVGDSPETGLSGWQEIVEKFPEYLPIYYQIGKAYLSHNQPEKAIELFSAGIALAEKQQDHHTLAELKSARMNALLDD
ncbi:MAG TPA: hypothetical protein PKY12_04955 [Catalimonadaceae bacterium]|nr:hypothetical protein [Catalimonadaceae bacterium]